MQVEYLLLQSSFTDFGLNLRTLLQLVLLLFNYLYGTSQSMVVTSLFDNLLEVFDETILLLLDASIELLFLLIDRELLGHVSDLIFVDILLAQIAFRLLF